MKVCAAQAHVALAKHYPCSPQGLRSSEQSNWNPLDFPNPFHVVFASGICFSDCFLVVNFESSASLPVGSASVHPPWPSEVLAWGWPVRGCVKSPRCYPHPHRFPIGSSNVAWEPIVGLTQSGGKGEKESAWNGPVLKELLEEMEKGGIHMWDENSKARPDKLDRPDEPGHTVLFHGPVQCACSMSKSEDPVGDSRE